MYVPYQVPRYPHHHATTPPLQMQPTSQGYPQAPFYSYTPMRSSNDFIQTGGSHNQKSPQPLMRSSSQQQRANESMRASQQLPLKQVASSAFLSKQALELKDSLEKLKQLSVRKNQNEQQLAQQPVSQAASQSLAAPPVIIHSSQPQSTQKEDLIKIVEEGDDERRETFGKSRPVPNFGIIPVSQIFLQDQQQLSPIHREGTQQSEQDLHKIYQYQETNESVGSADVINIYSEPKVLGQIDLVASQTSLRDEFQIQNNQSEHNSVKTYSKMTPEEAESAFQNRKNQIKNQIQKTKLGGRKMRQQDFLKKSMTPKVTSRSQKQLQTNQEKQDKQDKGFEQVISISRSNKKQRTIQEDTEPLRRSQLPISTTLQPTTIISPITEYQSKKKTLMQDIQNLDREIQCIESQLIENQPKSKPSKPKTPESSNASQSLNVQHRGDYLYQQGKLKDEKRKLSELQNKYKQKEEEMKECTFKPTVLLKSSSLSQQKSFTSKNPASAISSKFIQSAQKSNAFSQKSHHSRSRSKDEQEMFKSDFLRLTDYSTTQPQELFVDKVTNMSEKYQQILQQANQLKQRLGLN